MRCSSCASRRRVDSVLVTGVKRDIALLERVPRQPRRLGDGARHLRSTPIAPRCSRCSSAASTVEYFDHHYAGELPVHPGSRAHIDTSPGVCTGMLVDRAPRRRGSASGRSSPRSATISPRPARELAGRCGLDAARLAELRELGESIAYNAYGDTEADLHRAPGGAVPDACARYADPFRFMRAEPVVRENRRARRQDLELARASAARRRRSPARRSTCFPMRRGAAACAARSATSSRRRIRNARTRC